MYKLGKGVAFVLLYCGMLINSPIAVAGNIESLAWLPLLTANMKKLQPNINCPQNQINDLHVTKKAQQINSNIREVNWDLSCTSSSKNNETPSLAIDQQQKIKQFLNQLADLPAFSLNLNTLNLTSELLTTTFSTNLLIKKSSSLLVTTFKSDLLVGEINLDLNSQKIDLNATVMLDKLSNYFHLTVKQNKYFNNKLLLYYQSDLNRFQYGQFKVNWRGEVPDFSDQVELSIVGEINLLKEHLTLTNFNLNSKKILIPLADKQSWQTGYIKLKNSGPAKFNYNSMNIESFPLHLRIGSSSILTNVERGKSKRIRVDKQKLPALFTQLLISGKETDLLVDWGIAVLNQKLSGKVLLTPDVVKLQILENRIDVKSLLESTKRYVEGLDLIEMESGSVNINLLAEYHRNNKMMIFDSEISTDDMAGKQDNITFDGVTFNSRLHYLIDAQKNVSIIEDTQQLKAANLFVGVPIQALQIDAKVAAGEPVIQHFKARLLGGRLDFDDFKLKAPSQTILNIGGISLAELVRYSAYPEIETEAVIDGMLPLMLTVEGPQVTNGVLFARPPGGYIKVPENTVIKAMGRGNPAFSMTMQLLSNFQFDSMQGKIGYTSDGESDLKIKIKGISPTVSGTQPITFNYSHNENILKLLQILRFNDELIRNIEDRY